jgi:hypothetical protein
LKDKKCNKDQDEEFLRICQFLKYTEILCEIINSILRDGSFFLLQCGGLNSILPNFISKGSNCSRVSKAVPRWKWPESEWSEREWSEREL